MFLSSEPNEKIPIKQLRLKAITLLRPSDIAPKSTMYNPFSGQLEPRLFTTRQITFHNNGSASITFHGIQNDTSRPGFDVQLDPVSALHTYITGRYFMYITTRTEAHRPFTGAPVFITLKPPFRAIQTSTIANIMYRGNNPHCRIGQPGILCWIVSPPLAPPRLLIRDRTLTLLRKLVAEDCLRFQRS